MSKVWICQEKTAEVPFFLEDQKVNLYSLEELCYYLYQNAELAQDSLFDERLFEWLERELQLAELGKQLRKGQAQEQSSFWFLGKILWESGFYTREELGEVLKMAEQAEDAPPLERCKIRADKLLRNQQYKSALQEYQRILNQMEQEESEKLLEGRIRHNMGTAYAGQFLFAQAAECYKRAYELAGLEQSRQEYLLAKNCAEGNIPKSCLKDSWMEALQQKKAQGDRNGYEEAVYRKIEELAKEYMRSE